MTTGQQAADVLLWAAAFLSFVIVAVLILIPGSLWLMWLLKRRKPRKPERTWKPKVDDWTTRRHFTPRGQHEQR